MGDVHMTNDERAVVERLVKSMGFKTIETRNADALDFREVAVWGAVEAVLAAYREGAKVGWENGRSRPAGALP